MFTFLSPMKGAGNLACASNPFTSTKYRLYHDLLSMKIHHDQLQLPACGPNLRCVPSSLSSAAASSRLDRLASLPSVPRAIGVLSLPNLSAGASQLSMVNGKQPQRVTTAGVTELSTIVRRPTYLCVANTRIRCLIPLQYMGTTSHFPQHISDQPRGRRCQLGKPFNEHAGTVKLVNIKSEA
jgi:hypothetical protein